MTDAIESSRSTEDGDAPDARTPEALGELGRHSPPTELLFFGKKAWLKCGCGHKIDVAVRDGVAKTGEGEAAWFRHFSTAVAAAGVNR